MGLKYDITWEYTYNYDIKIRPIMGLKLTSREKRCL